MVTMRQAVVAFFACLSLPSLLIGCRDNDHVDTLHLNTGDAIARNKAIQTIDPWPRQAFKRRHATNGQRVIRAYDKYQEATPAKPAKKP